MVERTRRLYLLKRCLPMIGVKFQSPSLKERGGGGVESRGGERLAVGTSIGIAVRTKPCPVCSAGADLRQN